MVTSRDNAFHLLSQVVVARKKAPLDESTARLVSALELHLMEFDGTPEGAYARSLVNHYSPLKTGVGVERDLVEVYGLSSNVLDVPARVRNFFNDCRLTCVGYVVQFSQDDYLKYKNFGKGSFSDLMNSLHALDSRLKLDPRLTYIHDADVFKVKTCLEQPVNEFILNSEIRLFRFFTEEQMDSAARFSKDIRVVDFVTSSKPFILMNEFQQRQCLREMRYHLHPSIHFGMDKQYLVEKLGIEFAP